MAHGFFPSASSPLLLFPELGHYAIPSKFSPQEPCQIEPNQVGSLERVVLVMQVDPTLAGGIRPPNREGGIPTSTRIYETLDGPGPAPVKTHPHGHPFTVRGLGIEVTEKENIPILQGQPC